MPIRSSGRPLDASFASLTSGRCGYSPLQVRGGHLCAVDRMGQAFGLRSFLIQSDSVAVQRLSVANAIALQQSDSAAHTTPIQF